MAKPTSESEVSMVHLINRKALFIRDIDQSLSPDDIKREVLQCFPLARVVAPKDRDTGASLGCAYINFSTEEDARSAHKKWRHKLKLRGQPVKMMYAVDDEDKRRKVFGLWGTKFQVQVRNLSSAVDSETLCKYMEQHFGEVFQCKVDQDQYGQTYGAVHFMEEQAAQNAVKKANNTLLQGFNCKIQVLPFNKLVMHEMGPEQAAPSNSITEFPPLGGSSAAGITAAAAKTRAAGRISSPGMPSSSAGSSSQLETSSSMTATSADSWLSSPHTNQAATSVFSPAAAQPGFSAQQANLTAVAGPPPGFQNPLPALPENASIYSNGQVLPSKPAAPSTSYQLPLPLMSLYTQRATQPTTTPTINALSGSPSPANGIAHTTASSAQALGSRAAGIHAPLPYETLPNGRGHAGPKGGIRDSLRVIMSKLDHLNELLCCPITQELMREPVLASDGYTYEREAIQSWLTSHNTSPMTNEVLSNTTLLPNKLVKMLVEDMSG